jgi:hypothetical protein
MPNMLWHFDSALEAQKAQWEKVIGRVMALNSLVNAAKDNYDMDQHFVLLGDSVLMKREIFVGEKEAPETASVAPQMDPNGVVESGLKYGYSFTFNSNVPVYAVGSKSRKHPDVLKAGDFVSVEVHLRLEVDTKKLRTKPVFVMHEVERLMGLVRKTPRRDQTHCVRQPKAPERVEQPDATDVSKFKKQRQSRGMQVD